MAGISANTSKCGCVEEEILAMDLARKDDVKEIVKYYGAKLQGRNALICMEYMEGDNVLLVKSRTHVKLADFGLARNIEEHEGCRDVWKTGCLHIEMLNGERSSLHDGFVFGGGHPGQRSVIPGKHFPSQATEETKEFLKLIFGVDRKHPPSAAEMLHDAAVFK